MISKRRRRWFNLVTVDHADIAGFFALVVYHDADTLILAERNAHVGAGQHHGQLTHADKCIVAEQLHHARIDRDLSLVGEPGFQIGAALDREVGPRHQVDLESGISNRIEARLPVCGDADATRYAVIGDEIRGEHVGGALGGDRRVGFVARRNFVARAVAARPVSRHHHFLELLSAGGHGTAATRRFRNSEVSAGVVALRLGCEVLMVSSMLLQSSPVPCCN